MFEQSFKNLNFHLNGRYAKFTFLAHFWTQFTLGKSKMLLKLVMFPGSQIEKMFTIGAGKTKYTVDHGIAPYFYENLKANVNLADFYFISIDKSMNSIIKINQMDDLIRYWDSEANLVKVWFWNSSY